ncbi:MAG: protein translocase subunit SecD [Spirochaetales bacterium]|nr:protein translocase subunit SecD [Spirochaetales bacterium]
MKKTGRILLVLLVVVVASFLLYPTVKWYMFTPEATKELAAGSNLQIREYSRGQASRDVRVLKDKAKTTPDGEVDKEYKYLEKKAKEILKESGKSVPSKWTWFSLLSAFPDEASFFRAVEESYRVEIMNAKNLSGRVLNLGLDLRGGMSVLLDADTTLFEEKNGRAPTEEELTALLLEDIDVLSMRIDQFGVTEPDIRLQGKDQILIEIPGEADPERVNSFLRSSGSLSFHLVDDSLTNKVNAEYKKNPSSFIDDDGRLISVDYIPQGKTLLGYYVQDDYGIEYMKSLVVIYDEVALDGSHIENAKVSEGSTNNVSNISPSINFNLDAEGGNIFYAFTSAHKGDSLAVVMDDKVKSVATINSAIRDSVSLTGAFTQDEAQSLAVVLKTSSLPMELKVASQSAIGATLGDDSVKIALKALLAGVLLVIVFMVAYYGLSGLIADFALLMNLFMMIALLSALNFTLTLASIAGIVLTLGMAIDANVIIYERMKEEKATGKSGYEVVKAGFARAFWTIMDSNVTTIIAAVVLIVLGTSAVKGFAVTLAVGIGCSLFTSLLLSHLIFDIFITEESFRQVHLGWRRK